ncbi:hypothetical protein LINGRAHAP2_LOCUS6612 [Linum grandiflorum]
MASGFSQKTSLTLAFVFAVFLINSHLSSPASPPPLLPDYGYDYNITRTGRDSPLFTALIWTVAPLVFVLIFVLWVCPVAMRITQGRNTTILTVQVLLSDRAGDIGSVLLDIFRTNSLTLSQTLILKGTIDALLKHQKSFIYGSTSVQVIPQEGDIWNMDIMKKQEKQLRIQRARLDNGQRVPMLAPKQKKDNTLVIIMVATDGVHKLPSIHNSEGVKEALNYLDTKLAIIHAAHVVWSYQDPLPLQELLEICPDLNSIYD